MPPARISRRLERNETLSHTNETSQGEMNVIATEHARGLDEELPVNAGAELSPELLARIQSLYDAGSCRQAYELSKSTAPIQQWRGSDACILAGRIAMNLGAARL